MIIREATKSDIPEIQVVRHAVKENTLSDPSLVPDSDVEDYITRRGKGWVCDVDGAIVGFSIVSVVDSNVWALFVTPGFDRRGIGKLLHDEMMKWYFGQTDRTIWLGNAPGTRAEAFYKMAGWVPVGMHGKGEVKFEMTKGDWIKLQQQ